MLPLSEQVFHVSKPLLAHGGGHLPYQFFVKKLQCKVCNESGTYYCSLHVKSPCQQIVLLTVPVHAEHHKEINYIAKVTERFKESKFGNLLSHFTVRHTFWQTISDWRCNSARFSLTILEYSALGSESFGM